MPTLELTIVDLVNLTIGFRSAGDKTGLVAEDRLGIKI